MQLLRERRLRDLLVVLCIVTVLSTSIWARTASAALVPTETVVQADASAAARAKVAAFVWRDDVRTFLTRHGVDPAEAEARVATLSDAEVQDIAARVDALPAGQSSVGAVLGVIALILLILLLTDLLGWTNVYTFI